MNETENSLGASNEEKKNKNEMQEAPRESNENEQQNIKIDEEFIKTEF